MKKITLAIAIVLSLVGFSATAQGRYGADSAECVKHLSYYREYYNQKNYKDAFPNWKNAYNVCPKTVTENLFIHGTTLVNNEIKAAKGEERAALVDLLLNLQDERASIYPKNSVKTLNNKAIYIANNLQADPERAHKLYLELIDKLGEKSGASLLENNFRAVIQLFDKGAVDADYVFDTYSKTAELLDKYVPANDKEKDAIAQATSNVQGLFLNSKVANCEDMQKLFTPRLEANPEDLTLIRTIVAMLNTADDCTGNDLYFKAVTAMYKLDPSHQSAYALYKMNNARGNTDEAIRYLEEAYNAEDLDNAKRSEYAIELASFAVMKGKSGKAYELANQVISFNDSNAGKAYLIIAQVWAASHCSSDEARTLRYSYMVAVDYFRKAKAADPSLESQVNSLISKYSAYFPTAADAFMYGIADGQTITVSCGGMTATTTAKTNR